MTPFTNDTVVEFLHRFEELAADENFDLSQQMVHDNAVFRFNDGDFVGKQAIRAAFEKTWRGSAGVRKERFYLTDIVVLSVDRSSASATYTYNWEGSMDGKSFRIQGRGTPCSSWRRAGCRSFTSTSAAFPSPDTTTGHAATVSHSAAFAGSSAVSIA